MDNLSNSEKKKLFSIFENIDVKKDVENRKPKELNSDILIIDGLNTFCRAWCANPCMNDNGEHIGGMVGFLKSIGYAIRMVVPTRCVIVFDGHGGSMRRRKLYPDYKQKRHTRIRLNRTYQDISTPDLEDDSIKKQLRRLVSYLDCLPMTTMAIDNIEADDTIAYLTTEVFNREDQTVTIMSSDKDFLQLVNKRVNIWSPTKKKMYSPPDVLNEYGISCNNFIYYRVLDGDVSDNIDGIHGAGLKTVQKLYPMLADEKQMTLDELVKYSESNRNKYKLYETVASNRNILERNYSLMQLNQADISNLTKMKISEITDKKIPELNKFEFTKLMKEDNMFSALPTHHIWLQETFSMLDGFVKNSSKKN